MDLLSPMPAKIRMDQEKGMGLWHLLMALCPPLPTWSTPCPLLDPPQNSPCPSSPQHVPATRGWCYPGSTLQWQPKWECTIQAITGCSVTSTHPSHFQKWPIGFSHKGLAKCHKEHCDGYKEVGAGTEARVGACWTPAKVRDSLAAISNTYTARWHGTFWDGIGHWRGAKLGRGGWFKPENLSWITGQEGVRYGSRGYPQDLSPIKGLKALGILGSGPAIKLVQIWIGP